MSKANFDAVPDVDIDEGVFKYVYIRYSTYQIIFSEIVIVHFFSDARIYCEAGEDDRHEKDIVRGYTSTKMAITPLLVDQIEKFQSLELPTAPKLSPGIFRCHVARVTCPQT